MTDAEALLWRHLRGGQLNGHKFRRQFPIGHHIVDFACWDARLVIELDGEQHAENQADELRSAEIDALGFQILRFWNNDVLANLAGVLLRIEQALQR
jgi:BirA family biotin operon repressor/biotin-[acetyl-CoA-carboxylase] ligase